MFWVGLQSHENLLSGTRLGQAVGSVFEATCIRMFMIMGVRDCLSHQTCLIPIDSLLEAFDVFPEFPSLEYKIWRTLAVKISTTAIMKHIIYQVRGTSQTLHSQTQ